MAGAPPPIDPRGPRANQAVLATALLSGLVTGQTWVAGVFAAVLLLGAAFGPRWGPVLRVYQSFIRVRLGPPTHLEDPRPPRFAAAVGVVFLATATVAFALGADGLGWSLAMVVAALAGLAAATGLCVGCEMYVWFVRLRGGVRVMTIDRSTMRTETPGASVPMRVASDVPAPTGVQRGGSNPSVETWLVFTTEYCALCPSVVELLRDRRPTAIVRVVDVADEPALASRHRVRRAPTAVRTDGTGLVLSRSAGADAIRAELDMLDEDHDEATTVASSA